MPTVAEQYVKALRHFDNMYALWNPKPNTVLKPGYCGYFDEQGSWNQIVDLSNQEEATKFNYTQDLPEPEEDGLGKWEPACSENVKWRRAALEAPAKIPQLGIELKMKLEFSKDDKYGACLVTGPTVTCKYFSNRITLFDEWAKSNYSSISSSVRDVKDHGLWIITKVYETPRCAVAGWAGPASSLSLYAGAGAIFGGAITLQGTIAEERTSALWKFLPDDDSKSDSGWNSFTGNIFKSKSEKATPYVVFVSALRYKRLMPPFRPYQVGKAFRGEEDEEEEVSYIEVLNSNGDKMWIEREIWG